MNYHYQQTIQYLESFINYERWLLSAAERQKFNIERMALLLKHIGEPHEKFKFKSIHVAGSKGKGSTATMIASILTSAGYKAGLYTSPHLTSFRERIKVNGELISELQIVELVDKIKPSIEEFRKESKCGDATFFEIYTALAFKFFAEQKVDLAVVEAGLGGRLDATNVINPLVAVITPISFDHMEILGNTISQIAFEKSGIIKPKAPTITSPQPPEALEVIRSTAAQKGSKLIKVGIDLKWERRTFSDMKQHFTLTAPEGKRYELEIPILGLHQVVNSATAVGAIEALKSHQLPISFEAIQNGLKSVKLPGRVQVLRRFPTLIVDAAHNEDSARALRQTISESFNYNKLILIAGFSSDKDIYKIGLELCPLADVAILTKASNTPRAADPKNILQRWGDLCKNIDVIVAESVKEALKIAESMSNKEDMTCISGSFYIAGEALEILGYGC